MELRVIVIAMISLIILSMTVLMQGQRRQSPETMVNGIDLLDESITTPISRKGIATSSDLMGSASPTWHADEQGTGGGEAFEESEFEPDGDTELLEPDPPSPESIPFPIGSSGAEPQSDDSSAAPNQIAETTESNSEAMIRPDSGQDPLETTWSSSPSGELAYTDVPSPPQIVETDLAPPANPISEPEEQPLTVEVATTSPNVDPVLDSTMNPVEAAASDLAPPTEKDLIAEVPHSVAQIARNHLNYGNSLAHRGSLFSARQEFFAGLRLIIESLDLVNGVTSHRDHYGLAILALNEAEDFVKAPGDDMSNSVRRIVELHQSKILDAEQIQLMTSMAAMQAYFSFAQEHFSAACGQSAVASELLFSLGKLHTVKATQDTFSQPTDVAIAILMHQAALCVDSENYLSANELGVALARLGHYEPARAALLQSVATTPTPAAWLNLSIVHRHLGEVQLSDLAMAESKAAKSESGRETQVAHRIRWMEPNEFSNSQQVHYEDTEPVSDSPGAAKTQPKPEGGVGIWASLKRSFGNE